LEDRAACRRLRPTAPLVPVHDGPALPANRPGCRPAAYALPAGPARPLTGRLRGRGGGGLAGEARLRDTRWRTNPNHGRDGPRPAGDGAAFPWSGVLDAAVLGRRPSRTAARHGAA